MPGKVNPVIPEVVTQVAAQVIGNDQTIAVGGMQGHLELNVFVPVIARNLLESIRLLAAASRLFAEKCVDGIEANRENAERYAELTLAAAAALNPYIGYDRGAEIVKIAAATGRSLREVAREAGVSTRSSTRRSITGRWPSRTSSKPVKGVRCLTLLLAPVLAVGCGFGGDEASVEPGNAQRLVLQQADLPGFVADSSAGDPERWTVRYRRSSMATEGSDAGRVDGRDLRHGRPGAGANVGGA